MIIHKRNHVTKCTNKIKHNKKLHLILYFNIKLIFVCNYSFLNQRAFNKS